MSEGFWSNPPLWFSHAAIDLLPALSEPVAGLVGFSLFFVGLLLVPIAIAKAVGVKL